jgi:hypothetical protein
MPIEMTTVSRAELRVLALTTVNEDLDRAVARIVAQGGVLRLSGLSYQDRVRLKEAELENTLRLDGTTVVD